LLDETIDVILSGIASNADLLMSVPLRYSPKFIAMLSDRGLKFEITAEQEEEPSGGDGEAETEAELVDTVVNGEEADA
jgi:hypothetical protein